uniref:Ribosomal protein S14 n=1 Tax=Ditylenchus dipsaci TaxID=166011 RepID=A0A915DFT3_9BILA
MTLQTASNSFETSVYLFSMQKVNNILCLQFYIPQIKWLTKKNKFRLSMQKQMFERATHSKRMYKGFSQFVCIRSHEEYMCSQALCATKQIAGLVRRNNTFQ